MSPCDLESSFNPSFLSTTKNIFASTSSSNSRSSSTKICNDQSLLHQQAWASTNIPADNSCDNFSSSLQPSFSTPAFPLYRKPSITIKHSNDEESKSQGHQSSLINQQVSKSIDSNHASTRTISTTEHADQMSNNFIINLGSVTEYLQNNANNTPSIWQSQQKLDDQTKNLPLFNEDQRSGSSATMIAKTTITARTQEIIYSPNSNPLNLNLINQSHNKSKDFINAMGGEIVFNSNNPFLNDTFDAITAHEDEGGGRKIATNFFDMDDVDETETLLLAKDSSGTTTHEEMDEQLLKNKREKFSNTSTMKICLVVSPPTNKLFQVSSYRCNILMGGF